MIEPHIRHNNTIQTKGEGLRKTINIPFECEWPTTSMGADPLGFRIANQPYNFTTESSIVLKVKMTLYTDSTFQTTFEGRPVYGGCEQSGNVCQIWNLDHVRPFYNLSKN